MRTDKQDAKMESVGRSIRKIVRPTRFERVTFAFGGQTPTPPILEQRHLINRKNGVLQAPSNHATACFLTPRYVAVRNRAMALITSTADGACFYTAKARSRLRWDVEVNIRFTPSRCQSASGSAVNSHAECKSFASQPFQIFSKSPASWHTRIL